MVSLSAVSVTCGQSWPENIKNKILEINNSYTLNWCCSEWYDDILHHLTVPPWTWVTALSRVPMWCWGVTVHESKPPLFSSAMAPERRQSQLLAVSKWLTNRASCLPVFPCHFLPDQVSRLVKSSVTTEGQHGKLWQVNRGLTAKPRGQQTFSVKSQVVGTLGFVG